MSNADASRSRMTKRKIRWIAGLLSLLLAVTGGMSGRAADSLETSRDAQIGSLVDPGQQAGFETADLVAAGAELFGPVMEFERELETKDPEARATGPVPGLLADLRASRAFVDEAQGPASLEAGTALAPRAPPIA